MSDIRFNRWLHQSGTGGIYQDSSGNIGIGTSVPRSALDVQSGFISVGENVLSASGVSTFTTVNATTFTGNLTGNVTGNLTGTASTATAAATAYGLSGTPNLNVGVVTATTYYGSGANLTGVAPDGALRSVQYFTTSGTHTWTRPAGLQRVRVYVTGGGGGGALENTNTASGGGAGGTAIELIEVASLGSTETVTVGASGADRSGSYGPGSNGGTSSFGSHCSATGGGGGTNTYTGGGGIGSNGDFNIRGGPGHYSWGSSRSGNGGNSFWAGGGQGAGPNQAGTNGTFGSGGGGSTGSGGGAALISGAGGAGVVVVEEYF